MKKNKLFAVLVSILMFATVFMSGCAFFKGANKLELTEMPKSTYTLTENWEATGDNLKAAGFSFAIKLTKDDGVTTYVFGKTVGDGEVELTYNNGFYAEVNDVSAKVFELVDFNLSKAGKFTAKIKGEGAICTFVYTVKTTGENDGFAAGSGVEGDPYIIETTEQFMKLDSTKNADFFGSTVKYFKLNADINLAGKMDEHVNSPSYGTDKNTVLMSVKNISLDGNGHKLYNFEQKLDSVIAGITSGSAAFSNFDFYLDGQNMTFLFASNRNTSASFTKVNAYGSKLNASGNTGVYTAYTWGTLSFEGCKNYCNVDSTDDYVTAFVGYPSANVSFANCVNYGDVACKRASAFVCNSSPVGNWGATVTLTNCDNKGKLISIDASNMCFATAGVPDSSLTKDGKLEYTFKGKLNEKENIGTLSVDQTTYNNILVESNKVVLGDKTTQSKYFEKCAFNEAGELEVKLVANSPVTRVLVRANYLPAYYDKATGISGTMRQYISEELTISSEVMKTVNIKSLNVKILEKLPEGKKAATNDNKVWDVVDGYYVIEVDQLTDGVTLVANSTTLAKLEAGTTKPLDYTVYVFVGNQLVTGKSGKIADFKA